jgi:hypothetical protein
MACTRIADGDLTCIYEKEHPEWRTLSHKLVEQWPDRADLWDKYMELYVADLTLGDSTGASAHRLYLDNKDEMDRGAQVFDPLAYDPMVEASALERAYRKFVELGPEAFGSEYQGEIQAPDTEISITPDTVARKTNGVPRYQLPPGTLALTAFVDVGTASKLHYTVLATGPHRIGAVVDYGTYPPKGRLVRKGANLDEQEKALTKALVALLTQIYGQQYATEKGKVVHLHGVGVDRGWRADVVDKVCAAFQRKGFTNTLPVKGFPSINYYQGARSVIATGRDTDLRQNVDGTQFLAQNSDVWKEYAQRALDSEPLTPGSISLYGSNERVHAVYAQQCTAEKLVEKIKASKGMMYRWATARVGAQNHYLDSLSGACATAAWFRFLEPDAVNMAAIARERRGAAVKRAAKRTLQSPKVRRAMRLRQMRMANR